MVTPGPSEDKSLIATAPFVTGDVAVSGASVGRFVVLHTIGAGGAGVVVAAYDPVLDRRIALKVLRAGETPAGDARLIQEAQAMARLAHPNVVAVHEAGAAEGRVYLAMELIDGGTLRAWLTAVPRTWREIRDRFVEAGRGLAAAHDAGLVHRDFKPDNVLVGRDGRARVTDFGLVRAMPSVSGDGGGETTAVAGTPRYMAPEQHCGQHADPRADQFAFCVALYEALWRADPFVAPDLAARQARVLRGDITVPPPGKIPARLASAVLRGLAVDPARRHPTMRALLDEIVRDPELERRRRLRLVAVGLTGAGLATAINAAFVPETEGGTYTVMGAYGDSRGSAVVTARVAGSPDPQRFQFGIGVAWAPQWGSALPRSSWQAVDTANLDQIVKAGATSTNLSFDWSSIEPTRGLRDWSYADQQVAEVEKRGLEPFAYTGNSPTWAGRDPSARCPESFRNPPSHTGAGRAAFQEFFRALSNRYCGRVKHYEFWNEPNGCSWMSCGCGDQTPRQQRLYALWLDEWYQAMRDGCSDVVLAVGGLDCSWGTDPNNPAPWCSSFIDQLYANGAGDSFDAVALHPYGYGGDLDLALRDNKMLNWEAIRGVSAALQRHGNANRMLWVNEWGFHTSNDQLKANLIAATLTGLRSLTNVFEAQYLTVTDLLDAARPPYGLVSIVGPVANAQRQPRAAWFAFRDRALGPNTVWHGPVNPGMEFQGQPPTQQDTTPIPFWGPNGAWEFHNRFHRGGNGVLGRKFGYYAAGTTERFAQTLSDSFEARRRYCFRSLAQGGRDNVGVLPYQIGYIDARGGFVVLSTRTAAVDAQWRETAGVCYEVAASGAEIGRPIAVGFGSGRDGGASDIWFDNLRVTSTSL